MATSAGPDSRTLERAGDGTPPDAAPHAGTADSDGHLRTDRRLPPFGGWVVVLAAVVSTTLVAVSDRYGYHRDELYFLEAGQHLAWGYPDMPPVVPALARALSALAPGSLTVLRFPSALAGGAVVILVGLITREVGGGRAAQALAAVTVAASALLLGTEHYLDTSGLELLVASALLWLFVRLLRTGDPRLWPAIGVVVAVGLLTSDLTAALVVSLVVGTVVCRQGRLVRSPWALAAAVVAAGAWAPYLLWQAHHGWPELAVARAIAGGSSGTSTPRWLLLPSQLVLVSPYLAPVWIAGLVRLLRAPTLRWCRPVGVTALVLAVVFLVTGGKSYYLALVLPALVAAGAQPAVDWVGRGRTGLRKGLLAVAIVLTVPTTVLVMLPVLPATALRHTPIVALDYDEGETIGWPTYVDQIARAVDRLPPGRRGSTAVLTANYGEAGAVDRYGPALGLPSAHSGQDGFWYWGPPSAATRTYVVVGMRRATLSRLFSTCSTVGHLDNGLGVADQEQGTAIHVCAGLRSPWSRRWLELRDLG